MLRFNSSPVLGWVREMPTAHRHRSVMSTSEVSFPGLLLNARSPVLFCNPANATRTSSAALFMVAIQDAAS